MGSPLASSCDECVARKACLRPSPRQREDPRLGNGGAIVGGESGSLFFFPYPDLSNLRLEMSLCHSHNAQAGLISQVGSRSGKVRLEDAHSLPWMDVPVDRELSPNLATQGAIRPPKLPTWAAPPLPLSSHPQPCQPRHTNWRARVHVSDQQPSPMMMMAFKLSCLLSRSCEGPQWLRSCVAQPSLMWTTAVTMV